MRPNSRVLDAKSLAVLRSASRIESFTKMDVVRATRLSLPTVNGVLAALLAHKYVTALGSAKPTNGRPPIQYRFNPMARYAIGVEVQVPMIAIGLVNLHAQTVRAAEFPFDDKATSEYVVDTLQRGIDTVLGDHRVTMAKLVGIGLGVPGFVERNTGTWLRFPRVPSVRDIPLRTLLETNFQLPVQIQNEINVYALAELQKANYRSGDDVLMITCAEGLKASVVVDGRILTGDEGNFGSVGHLIVVENGIPCFCGACGCLEMYASGYAFRRDLRANGSSIPGLEDSDASLPGRVFRLAAEGEPACRQLVEQSIPHLAHAFASLIRLTNIDRVVLLGAYTEGGDYLRDLLHTNISQRLPEIARPRLSLRIGSPLRMEDLIAAAALPAIQSFLGFPKVVAS